MKKVSIITVNYNQPEVTREMLVSLRSQGYKNLEVVVVDNGSSENPEECLTRDFPEILFVRSESNLGFAGGNNLGISHATGDYLFFLNNDTEVPEGTIEELVETLENNPDAGSVSPVIFYYDQPGVVQYAGYTPINYLTGRNNSVGFGTQMPLQMRIVETSFTHGAAMMVPRRVIDKVGPMPENYFLYYEELDWVAQMRKAGFNALVNMSASVLHKESISTGKGSPLKTFFQTRNRILFMRRNTQGWKRLTFMTFFCLVAFPKNIFAYLLRIQLDQVRSYFLGTWWNLTHSVSSTDLGPFNYLIKGNPTL